MLTWYMRDDTSRDKPNKSWDGWTPLSWVIEYAYDMVF